MKSKGLDKRQYHNVLMIAPAVEISEQEKKELSLVNEISNVEPLKTEILKLRFSKADNIEKLIKSEDASFLSERGRVSVDERTNALLLQDTPSRLTEIRSLIKALDVPVKQILVEARIVNAENNFERQLGIRFGITKPSNGLTGTLEGANALRSGGSAESLSLSQRLNVDFGASAIAGTTPASVGLALARLGGGHLLDLELSALESEGLTHVISTPRIMTSNQTEAYFETGEDIPFQGSSSSGATDVSFQKAVLSLGVTPQITPDNKIIMSLHVTQNTRGAAVGIGLPPAINTNEVRTRVLVGNGHTIVLGGFYRQNKEKSVERVPFLGALPVVGSLFRHKARVNRRNELLIFITPRIVDQDVRV